VISHLDPRFKLSPAQLKQMVVLSFAFCDGISGRRVFNKDSMNEAIQMTLIRTMFESLAVPASA
jgi:hypothetical protein